VALSLLELGLAEALLAGAAEAHDGIVDAVLGGDRGEGGGFVVLESARSAASRGHLPLARVALHRALRGDVTPVFAELEPPRGNACIVSGRLPSPIAGALARSSWHGVPVHELLARVGYHEAVGALALAAAAAELAAGSVEQVLVVTADLDTVYVTRLERPESSQAAPRTGSLA
jgi:hypothetical protein